MKQRTIAKEVTVSGKALHSGAEVSLTIKPAPENTGIVFKRTDVFGKPEIKPHISLISSDLVRNTGVTSGHIKLHTIEHVLSSMSGMNIDNCIVEMNAGEPPIMDGSAKAFVKMIKEADVVEQSADVEVFELKEPVSITDGNRSVIALPYSEGLKITCTSADDRGTHTQHLSIDIDPDSFENGVSSARTFTVYEDIEPLLKIGKIQGGSLDSAIVIKGDKILSKEPLRFKDEFVRHKILDIIGDIALLGVKLKAHIIAARTGHSLNARLTAEIYKQMLKYKSDTSKKVEKKVAKKEQVVVSTETTLDTRRILDLITHRYPFVLIDRIEQVIDDTEVIAIKNVTINEPFFQGHFPGNPVMPGVLQLEAMAQAAGILMFKRIDGSDKLAFFMSADKVKFRKAVKPGDQLRIHGVITKNRGNKVICAKVECSVADSVVSSAELMFSILDVNEAP
ncbi:MAG: bifunctional UDP-3-O-[3-hydroxymyristoyl] N-acetylglucosamine deacetylase/3-hydroxyacyl-ACP dehydratase [Opitutales bacterium]|nr:bifunctional UDP-3-O-[3-hydroxymyristoyl] N-acetylglucosamine deacetylase/3-hydroxyacyl-ACP dehydratase [Opitutales bacterium]